MAATGKQKEKRRTPGGPRRFSPSFFLPGIFLQAKTGSETVLMVCKMRETIW